MHRYPFAVLLTMAMPGVAATCESLASLSLPDTTITTAQSVPAGGFSLPGGNAQGNAALQNLPAFCRVAATLKPSSDSDIRVEVWLPAAGWNGKFQGVGNGGWAGSISYGALGQALRRGYATSRPTPAIRATSAAPASRWATRRRWLITPTGPNTR